MNRLRKRLSGRPADAGFTLIEVVVALVVFAIAATGLAAGSAAITRISADSRARDIATAVAAAELDKARSAPNPLKVLGRTYTTDSTSDPTYVHPVDSTHVYTVVRTVASVAADGSDTTCGANTNFGYRRVTVTVSWPGQLSTTQPVRSDTILAPAAPATDAGVGAISVRVTGSDGTPRSGVAVAVAPTSGGQALATQPVPTDAQGCTYVDRVVPGTYSVTLSKTNYIDINQQETPVLSTTVAAGSTSGLQPTYDAEANFVTNYADNYTGTGSGSMLRPTNLTVALVPDLTSMKISLKSAVDGDTVPRFPGGYSAVAGGFADTLRNPTCNSMDPWQWPAKKVSGVKMAQGARATAGALSGQTATFGTSATQTSIPMGVIRVSLVTGKGQFLTVRAANPTGTDNPGCGTLPGDLTFSATAGSTAYVAVPFGSWSVYQGAATGAATNAVPAANLIAVTNTSPISSSASGNPAVVTLDPRLLAP